MSAFAKNFWQCIVLLVLLIHLNEFCEGYSDDEAVLFPIEVENREKQLDKSNIKVERPNLEAPKSITDKASKSQTKVSLPDKDEDDDNGYTYKPRFATRVSLNCRCKKRSGGCAASQNC